MGPTVSLRSETYQLWDTGNIYPLQGIFFPNVDTKFILEWEKLRPNVFIINFSQQILSSKLLLVVINELKSNLSYKFKSKLVTTYHL